jgi:hypothetical protein
MVEVEVGILLEFSVKFFDGGDVNVEVTAPPIAGVLLNVVAIGKTIGVACELVSLKDSTKNNEVGRISFFYYYIFY